MSDDGTELFDNTLIMREIRDKMYCGRWGHDVEQIISEHITCSWDRKNFIRDHAEEILDLCFEEKCEDVIVWIIEQVGEDCMIIDRLSDLMLNTFWEQNITKRIFEIVDVNSCIGSYRSSRYIELVVRANNDPDALRWILENIENIEINYHIPGYLNLMGVLVSCVIGRRRKRTLDRCSYEVFELLAPYFDLKNCVCCSTRMENLLKTMCRYDLHIDYFTLFFELCPDYEVKPDELAVAVEHFDFDAEVCDLLHEKCDDRSQHDLLYSHARSPAATIWLLNKGYDPVAGSAFFYTCGRHNGDLYLDILREKLDSSHLTDEQKRICVERAEINGNVEVVKYLVAELHFPFDDVMLELALSSGINREIGHFLVDYYDFSTSPRKFSIFYYDTLFYLLVEKRINPTKLTARLDVYDFYNEDDRKDQLVRQWLTTPAKQCPVELEHVLKWYPGRHLSFPDDTRSKIRALLTLARTKTHQNLLSKIPFDILLHIFDWVSCAP